MSDTVLYLIPTEPTFVPQADRMERAQALARQAFPGAEAVELLIGDEVTFVDCGENLQRAACPRCKTNLLDGRFGELMDVASKTHFVDRTCTLPCCGERVLLDDLEYDWSCGFARFRLKIVWPHELPTPELVRELEGVLECPLRQVWAYY